MIVSKQASLKTLISAVPAQEASVLASGTIIKSKDVSNLVKKALSMDVRGATDANLRWMRRYVRYYKKKRGLQRKQIECLMMNMEDIIKRQQLVIKYEGSLEAVYGENMQFLLKK